MYAFHFTTRSVASLFILSNMQTDIQTDVRTLRQATLFDGVPVSQHGSTFGPVTHIGSFATYRDTSHTLQ